MALLAISMTTAPYRALLIGDAGTRTLVATLDEPPEPSLLDPTVYVDRHGVEVGRRAVQAADLSNRGVFWSGAGKATGRTSAGPDGVRWTHRDLYAFVFRRALLAASTGAALPELALIVPPLLEPDDKRKLEAAALLAGAPTVRLIEIGELLPAAGIGIGERVMFVVLDMDQMRAWVCRVWERNTLEVIDRPDPLDAWSGQAMIRELARRCGLPARRSARIDAILAAALENWGDRGDLYELAPNPTAPPTPVLIPADIVSGLADGLLAAVGASMRREGSEINRIRLQGALAQGLRARVEAMYPDAEVVAESSAALLELVDIQPRAPELGGEIFADLADARAPSPQSPTATRFQAGLAAGRPLSAAEYVSEVFPGDRYAGGAIGLYESRSGQVRRLGAVEIPPSFRGRPYIMVQIRACADGADYLLVKAAVGFPENETLLLYDRATGESEVVAPATADMLAQMTRPSRAGW